MASTSITDKITSSFCNLLNKEVLKPLSEYLFSQDLSGKDADDIYNLLVEFVSVKNETKKRGGKKSAVPKADPKTVEDFLKSCGTEDICGYAFSKGATKGMVCSTPVDSSGFIDMKDPKMSRCKTHVGKPGSNVFKTKGVSRPAYNASASQYIKKGASAISPSVAIKPPAKLNMKKYEGLKNMKKGDTYTDFLSDYDGERHFVFRKNAEGIRTCIGKIKKDISGKVIDPLTYEKKIVALDKPEVERISSKFKYEFVHAYEADTEDSDVDEVDQLADTLKKKAVIEDKPAKRSKKEEVTDSDDSEDDEEVVVSVKKEKPKKEKKKTPPPAAKDSDEDSDNDEEVVTEKKETPKKEKKKTPPPAAKDSDEDSDDDEEVVVSVKKEKPKKEKKKTPPPAAKDSDEDSDDDEEVVPAKKETPKKEKKKTPPPVAKDSDSNSDSDEDVVAEARNKKPSAKKDDSTDSDSDSDADVLDNLA